MTELELLCTNAHEARIAIGNLDSELKNTVLTEAMFTRLTKDIQAIIWARII